MPSKADRIRLLATPAQKRTNTGHNQKRGDHSPIAFQKLSRESIQELCTFPMPPSTDGVPSARAFFSCDAAWPSIGLEITNCFFAVTRSEAEVNLAVQIVDQEVNGAIAHREIRSSFMLAAKR